jgi:CheY-like chemotaxis protein
MVIKLNKLNILLADDDSDDCLFFKKVLEEMSFSYHLATVNDGEQLMEYLGEKPEHPPDILFLDLNMPRKNGFECLCELKENAKLKDLPVVMFSTSYPQNPAYEDDMIKRLMKIGAIHFIRKSGNLELLKKEIQFILNLTTEKAHNKQSLDSGLKSKK